MTVLRSIGLALLTSLLLGCGTSGTMLFTGRNSTLTNDPSSETIQEIDYTGIHPVIERTSIEPINLLLMLDPDYEGKAIAKRAERGWYSNDTNILRIDEKYEYAFEAFARAATRDPREGALRRNRVQDRILLSSDQRCGIYRRLLLQVQSDADFWFGTGATISGLLGPLFGERGAKNLAVLSGLFSGTRAQVGQSYFYNLAVPVISKGIEERRKSILERMHAARAADIQTYTVQAAVKDAVFYDSQCSVIAGLEEAAEAIRLVSDPGLEAANRTLLKAKLTRAIVSANTEQEIDALGKRVLSIESNPLMASNRFSNVGVPLAGVAVAPLNPAFAVVRMSTLSFAAADLDGTNDIEQAKSLRDSALERKEISASGMPSSEQIGEKVQPLLKSMSSFEDARKACISDLTTKHATYARLELQSLTETSEAQVITREQLSSLSAEAERTVRVMTGIRESLQNARQEWRDRVKDSLAKGKVDIPPANSPAAELQIKKLTDGKCQLNVG